VQKLYLVGTEEVVREAVARRIRRTSGLRETLEAVTTNPEILED